MKFSKIFSASFKRLVLLSSQKSGDTTLLLCYYWGMNLRMKINIYKTRNAALELPGRNKDSQHASGIPFHSPQGKVLCYFAIDSFGNMSRLSGWLFLLSALSLFPNLFSRIVLFKKVHEGVAWIVLVVLIGYFYHIQNPGWYFTIRIFSAWEITRRRFFFNSLWRSVYQY